MPLYASIASLLEDISKAERSDKAAMAAGLLAGLQKEMLCPCVRLLTGELWPSWENREMGIGPEAVTKALEEISSKDVQNLRKTLVEMGVVAEAAIRNKSQHPISCEPLDAILVYKSLGRISGQNGPDSEHRREAILRGLFQDAGPVEAKYIARTAMRKMQVGLGPKTMIAAIAIAYGIEAECVRRTYAFMPELGLVAEAVSSGNLAEVGIKLSRPVRPMLVRQEKISNTSSRRAYLPRYPGLQVQVHKAVGKFFVFTMRLKDVTSAMSSLSHELLAIGHDFIAEAQLVGFQDGLMLGQPEIVRYINRRNLSRRSTVVPALVVRDLLYLDGIDLTTLAYDERRNRLVAVFGEPKGMPFAGISTAEQRVLERTEDVEKYNASKGLKGLMARDLSAPYRPGRLSDVDFNIKAGDETAGARNYGRWVLG